MSYDDAIRERESPEEPAVTLDREPDLEILTVVVTRTLRDLLNRDIPAEEISLIVRDTLHGERRLWQAFLAGIVTRREVASALLGRAYTRMIDKHGLPGDTAGAPTPYDPISETEKALFTPTARTAS